MQFLTYVNVNFITPHLHLRKVLMHQSSEEQIEIVEFNILEYVCPTPSHLLSLPVFLLPPFLPSFPLPLPLFFLSLLLVTFQCPRVSL